MPLTVTLPVEEIIRASITGFLRQCSSLKKGLKDAHGYSDEGGWEMHRLGAVAELAAATALRRYWPESVDTFAFPDIPPDIQVRLSKRVNMLDKEHNLTIRPDSKDNEKYVLVRKISDNTFRVLGWIEAGEAKKHKEWYDNPGNRPYAWFVPFENLRDINDLIL